MSDPEKRLMLMSAGRPPIQGQGWSLSLEFGNRYESSTLTLRLSSDAPTAGETAAGLRDLARMCDGLEAEPVDPAGGPVAPQLESAGRREAAFRKLLLEIGGGFDKLFRDGGKNNKPRSAVALKGATRRNPMANKKTAKKIAKKAVAKKAK